MEIFSK